MELSPQQDLLTEEKLIINYAGFWPRFWALLLDGLILGVFGFITYYNKLQWQSTAVIIAVLIIQLFYKSFFEFKYGATPGKMALSIRVVNYDFEKPTLTEVLLRNIFQISFAIIYAIINIYLLSYPIYSQSVFAQDSSLNRFASTDNPETYLLIINFLMFAIYLIDFIFLVTNEEHRSLHDRIGKTYVIKS